MMFAMLAATTMIIIINEARLQSKTRKCIYLETPDWFGELELGGPAPCETIGDRDADAALEVIIPLVQELAHGAARTDPGIDNG